jgi:uncharacterized membrane protein
MHSTHHLAPFLVADWVGCCTPSAEVKNMAKLSTAAWMAHNVGLATSIGGTMFSQEAMKPALNEITDPQQREQIADLAWRRFSWVNLAGHAAVAATWFFGRSMLSGRSVSNEARRMTVVKDALVIASLATGIATMVLGRVLGARVNGGDVGSKRKGGDISSSKGSQGMSEGNTQGIEGLRKVINVLGMANLAANVGVAGITTALSMESSKSLPFSLRSRVLP